LVAAAVFLADAFTPPECVVSGLYVLVVLISGRFCRPRQLWLISAGCVLLTLIGQALAHHVVLHQGRHSYVGMFNSFVSIVAINLSTYLILRAKAAEISLYRVQTDLAHVSRTTSMGELTAAIGHEINQPIAGIVTNGGACLRWLAKDPPDLEKTRAAVNRVVRDGNRAAEIVAGIREMFTKGNPQRRPVNVNHLLKETIEVLRNEAERYKVSVRMTPSADAPWVEADPIQLQQVVVNLVMNGIEAMKNIGGTRDLTIEVTRSEDRDVIVSVSDTGPGLPDQDPETLFDAFFTTKPTGTGMGLAISRSIIEAHQGRLWAKGREQRGATFIFALPLAS
jgi:C4-dicarboxylate-specific signal transduction histidine kinase